MRFTLVLFLILPLAALAQYIPEIDSLFKTRTAQQEDQKDDRKFVSYFHILINKKYGVGKVQEQTLRALQDANVTLGNKILFAEFLGNTLFDAPQKQDSLMPIYFGLLEKNYSEAADKCRATRFLFIKAALLGFDKQYALIKSTFDRIESDLKQAGCISAFIPYYLALGNTLYKPLGNTTKATEVNLKALHLIDSLKKAKQTFPTYYELDVYNEIASLNYHTGNWNSAIQYWKKGIAIIEKNGEWDNYLTSIYNNIGISYRHLKKSDSTLYYLNKSIERAIATNDQAWVGIATGNIGDIYTDEGKYEEAIPYLEKDITSGYLYYQYGSVTTALAKLGYCYYQLHQYPKAKLYYDSALTTFKRWPNPIAYNSYTYNVLLNIYRNYASLEFTTGKFKSAFLHQRNAEVFDDSLKQMLKRQEIASLQTYHAFEQQETENKLLKTEINAQKLRESRTIIFILMIVAVAIFVWILYRLRLQKLRAESAVLSAERQVEAERAHRLEKEMVASAEINRLIHEKTEEQLLLKERELSSITMQIQQKNEVMANLKNQLGSMAQKETSLQDEFKSIYKSIRKDLNLNADWDKFKLHFEKVHPDFFTKLSSEHHDLSLSDLRICAYLRMNMDNNSMSQILNISPDSLRVRRHRLRKRIGITSDKDLYSYLLSI